MPPKKFNISLQDLKRLFIEQNMSRKRVAEHYGCSEVLIKKKCQEYGIKKPKQLENKNKERKEWCSCVWCGRRYSVSRFRVKNVKWLSKFCSTDCSSRSRFLGEAHKRAVLNSIAANRRVNFKKAKDKKANAQKIKDFYIEAKRLSIETGIPHEVDHIVPISKGGKHHEKNLQILTREENRRKHTKNV